MAAYLRRALAPAGELRVQPSLVLGAQVRQRVVVDAHPAADPAVSVIALAQAVDLAGRAHAVYGGPQPQRHQDRRGDGRCATAAGHRLDACIQRRQVHRLHERPHGARPVIGRQQRIQIDRAQLDLVALRRHDSRSACRLGRLRHTLGGPLFSWTEQTRLGLFTLVSNRRSTHALLNASGAGFVHTL